MRRWLAMVLCAVLLVGVLPVVAVAAGDYLNTHGLYLNWEGTSTTDTRSGAQTTVQLFAQTDGNDGRELLGSEYTSQFRVDGEVITAISVHSFNHPDFGPMTDWQLTVAKAGTGTITRTVNGTDYTVTITFTEESGGDNPFADLTKISESGPVTAGDEKIDTETVKFQPVSFTYNDATYYIGPAWALDQHNGDPVMGDSEGFLENEGNLWKFRIGFWTARQGENGLEYTKVSSEQLYETLFSQFTNLSLTMKPTANCTTFPALYHDGNQTHLYADVNHNTAGLWVLQVTGERNSTAITAYGDSECLAQTGTIREFDSNVTLPQVSEYFQDLVTDKQVVENGVYTAVIPAGHYEGNITTPQTPNGVTFEIRGAQDENGNNAVTIHGGVIANADETRLTDLQFVGTGKNDATDNDCLTGTGRATFWGCTFRDFNTAVTCTDGLRWGGSQCLFENNQVALHMKSTSRNGGNGEMPNYVFKDNGIALKLERFAPGMPIYAHHMTDCQFINNGTDVDNTSGRMFFMPKQFFGTQANGSDVTTPGSPKFGSAGNVSAFPTATTTSFDTFDYSPDEALVSNSLTYTIPTDNLTGKTITVIDQTADADKTLATWTFEGGGAEGGN